MDVREAMTLEATRRAHFTGMGDSLQSANSQRLLQHVSAAAIISAGLKHKAGTHWQKSPTTMS